MTEAVHKPNQGRRYRVAPGILVFLGGALGASARAGLDAALAPTAILGFALSTVIVNVVGAFLLGLITAAWIARRSVQPRWDRLKIFMGTGFMGAFTTYSSFAVMLAHAEVLSAFAWVVAIGVVIVGMLAVVAGYGLGQYLNVRGGYGPAKREAHL